MHRFFFVCFFCFVLFCLVLALKSLKHPPTPKKLSYQAWCCHRLLDLASSPSLPADHQSPGTNMHSHTHTRAYAHTHTHKAWYVWNKPSSFVKPLAQTQAFRLFGIGHDSLLSTLDTSSSSPVPTACKNPCTNYPDTPPKHRTEPSTKTNKGCVLSSFHNEKK